MPASPLRVRLLLVLLLAFLVLPTAAFASSFTPLTSSPGIDRNPSWTPDGQHILFDSNRSGAWRLYRMNADGSGVTLLETGLGLDAVQPLVSPDGQWVTFIRGPMDPSSGSIEWSQICIMPYPSGPVTELTSQNSANLDEYPSWSPDGATVYFDRRFDGDYHIYKVPAVGGPATLVVSQGQADIRPVISPDGVWLTYFSRPTQSSALNAWEAPVANLAARTQLTFESKNTGASQYSPDATKLLIGSRRGTGHGDLYELERASGILTRLTFDSDIYLFNLNVSGGYYRPTNIDQIVFSSARVTGDRDIWLLDRQAPPVDPNVLRVIDAIGLPGGAPVPVQLTMTNDRTIRALQFEIADSPDHVTVTGVTPVQRGLAMQADFSDDGAARILVFPNGTGTIGAGVGPFLELSVDISLSASLGDTIDLNLGSVLAVDANGQAFPLPVLGGRLVIARRPGDIDGNNQVDGGDLVRLVDIILERGAAPTAEELDAADCNTDSAVDIIDVLCLQELIGPEAALVILPLLAEAGHEPLDFELLEPVRAIAVDFADEDPLPVPMADIAPFATRAWRMTGGGVRVLASDLGGGAWSEGPRAVLSAAGTPQRIRAWGENGRVLPIRVADGRILVGAEATAPPVAGFSLAPNPFTDDTTLRFAMPASGVVRIRVFDVAGRAVRTWDSDVIDAGAREWTWDGRDDGGQKVTGGVYFARINVPGATATLRMVRIDR